MKQLKILFLLTLLPALATVQSCEKVENAINFGFNIDGEFTMPPNIPINTPLTLPGIPMDYNSEETFEQNNTRADLVKKITIDYIKMNILEPVGQDFSFVKDIEILFDMDGVGEKLVAWKYDVDDNVGGELSLDVTPDDLSAYLKGDGVKMTIKVTTDKITTQEVKMSYDIRTRVTADVFK
jgi:hypothetical protein